jgi:hypothetical protein
MLLANWGKDKLRHPHELEATGMKTYLTAGDASYVLRVTPAAVRAMADRGELEMAAETEGGIRLFRREDVEALAEKRYAEKELPPDEDGG